MLAYVVRRLLLMIPTFVGILVINFAVMRLQGFTLAEQMKVESGKGSEGVASERKVQGASKNVENYIDRFRRAGNDLPALINTRGFWTKADVVSTLRAAAPATGVRSNAGSRGEKQLWLAGHFAVEPLYQVLADDALQDLHPGAATAFALCAYASVDPGNIRNLSNAELNRIQSLNETLRTNRFDTTSDPGYETKRRVLMSVYEDPVNRPAYVHTTGKAWKALFMETGFTDLMTKLFTGRLYSETRKEYAFTIIGERWYISFGLNFLSIIIAWGISIPLGIRSARRVGTLEDRATTNSLFLLWSLPSFFVGTLLLHHLCTNTSHGAALFPNRGLSSDDSMWYSTPAYLLDLLWHATLPLIVLCYGSFTSLSRYMRGNLLDQLNADYTRTARAKGASEDAVVYGHAVKNSMLTMITLGAGLLSELFGGFVIVESIFSIQGLGTLLLDAARQQDAPLIMASTVISVALLLVGILVADLLYAVIDPRIRSKYG